MDRELQLVLKGHGLDDFVTEQPEGDLCVQVEVFLEDAPGAEPWETLHVSIGLGEEVLAVIGDWLDGHSEFSTTYAVYLWQFVNGQNVATITNVRAAKGHFTS